MNEIAFYSVDSLLVAVRNLVEAQSPFSINYLTDGSVLLKTQNSRVATLLEADGVDGNTYFVRI